MSSVKSHPGCAGKCKEEQPGSWYLVLAAGEDGSGGEREGDGGLWVRDGCRRGRQSLLGGGEMLLRQGDHCGEEERESIVVW